MPTVQVWGANHTIGTPFHTWQMVAQGKSPMAYKGMVHAAQAMAATGVDALLDAGLRDRAWADMKKPTGPNGYVCPLAADAEPPVAAMG